MTVVVGYVPNETGFVAVQEAVRQARALQTDVVLVNAVGYAGHSAPTAADEQQMDAIDAYLEQAGVRHELRQINQVSEKASVAGLILDAARETGAELIVVGLHRRSALAVRLLGSTIQSIALAARCPMLIVPHVDDAAA